MTTEGFTLSCNITEKDGKCVGNIDYSDTNDIFISQSVSGDDPEEILETLAHDVMEELLYQSQLMIEEEEEEESGEEVDDYVAKLEAMVKQLQNENDSLRLDNDILQRRADDAVNKSLNTKKYNDGSVSSEDLFDLLYRMARPYSNR